MPATSTDPWLTRAMRHRALLAAGEHDLMHAVTTAQRVFLDEARAAILEPLPASATFAGRDRDPTRFLSSLPGIERWRSLLREHVLPALRRVWQRAYRRGTGTTPSEHQWTTVADEYRRAIDRDEWAERVLSETRREADDSATAGDTPDLVRARLERLLRLDAPAARFRDTWVQRHRQGATYQPTLGPSDFSWRNDGRTRARWLTVGATNRAQLDAARELGASEVRVKRWSCLHDGRTRDTHVAADQQTVPLSHVFTVGGEEMRYPGDPLGPPAERCNCRCSLDLLTSNNDEDAMSDDDGTVTADGTHMTRWRGMLAPLDTRADYRVIGEPDELRTNQQMWLSHQEASAQGHDGKRRVGRIDRAWIENGQLWAEGAFNPNKELASDVATDIRNGFDGTVSVDLADAQGEEKFFDENGVEIDLGDMDEATFAQKHPNARKLMYYPSWRLSGATLVQDPAYHTGFIEVIDDTTGGGESESMTTEDEGCVECSQQHDGEEHEITTAAEVPEDEHIDAGTDTDPDGDYDTEAEAFGDVPAEKRKRAEDNGAAMQGGRYPIENEEDLRKAIKAIGRAGGPGGTSADRVAVKRHIIQRARALGKTNLLPEDWASGGSGAKKDDKPAKGRARGTTAASAHTETWAHRVAQAAWDTPEPPREFFEDPRLTGPTKVTVDDTGRVYGHVACWESSHIAFPGRDVKPPRSETNYGLFHRHPVRCADGSKIKTGVLVMGTGHADLNMSTSAASSHYDHTGHIVADVRAGEDEYGIWISGFLHPDVTPLQVNVLDRYSLSGDWRGGELVAALCVNTPGFPIPDSLAASGEIAAETPSTQVLTDDYGDAYALVAAGIVAPRPDAHPQMDVLAEEIRNLREELASERERREWEASRQRVEAVKARIHGDVRFKPKSKGKQPPMPPGKGGKQQPPQQGQPPQGKDGGKQQPPQKGGGKDAQQQKTPKGKKPDLPHDHMPSDMSQPDTSHLEQDDHDHMNRMSGHIDDPRDIRASKQDERTNDDGHFPHKQDQAQDDEQDQQDSEGQQQTPKGGSKDGKSGQPGTSGQFARNLSPDEKANVAKSEHKNPNSWVDRAGGLPTYVKRIVKHLQEKGMSKSHAIATAINVTKKMCAGTGAGNSAKTASGEFAKGKGGSNSAGDRLNWPGAQRNVNAGSIAEACKSVSHWEGMKAHAKSHRGGSSSKSSSGSSKSK